MSPCFRTVNCELTQVQIIENIPGTYSSGPGRAWALCQGWEWGSRPRVSLSTRAGKTLPQVNSGWWEEPDGQVLGSEGPLLGM